MNFASNETRSQPDFTVTPAPARVHANFAEYVPLALLLLAFVEIQQFAAVIVYALCLMLVAGRVPIA